MPTTSIRQKLHQFIDNIEDKKVKAIYTLFADEIEQGKVEYTNELKSELDRGYTYYKQGGKMVSATQARKQVKVILQSGKKK